MASKFPMTTGAEPTNGQPAGQALPNQAADEPFEALQNLLVGERVSDLRRQIEVLRATLATLERELESLNDAQSLAEKIKPGLAPAISASIRESREEMVGALSPIIDRLIGKSVRESQESMVDALYPIIGRLVARAVTEALRDLAHRIDTQMRSTFGLQSTVRRLQARLSGVSEAELAIRDALPFQVLQLFLIHRETGLLLHVLNQDPNLSADSDIISSMLTAIRDFAEDAFGRGQEGELDEVQYGGRRIVIESARYAYIALVITGNYPGGLRTQVRERLLEIEYRYNVVLRSYAGNAARLEGVAVLLAPLLAQAASPPRHRVNPSDPARPLRHELKMRPAFAVRLTFFLTTLVFILAGWRMWHTLSNLPNLFP